jgi:hypothetical protein
MDCDLQYLVHFFNDPAHLFETISMADESRVDEICDTISSGKGWYWPRFAPGERQGYLLRRRFVEKTLYEDYTRAYGELKGTIPVYFYLYPGIDEEKAIALARQRAQHGETEPHVLMVKIQDIQDTRNMTFTLNDSHTAYWQRLMDSGLPRQRDGKEPVVLPDHNRVFPFAMLKRLVRKYKHLSINYEIQIWDRSLLERLPTTILEPPAA